MKQSNIFLPFYRKAVYIILKQAFVFSKNIFFTCNWFIPINNMGLNLLKFMQEILNFRMRKDICSLFLRLTFYVINKEN